MCIRGKDFKRKTFLFLYAKKKVIMKNIVSCAHNDTAQRNVFKIGSNVIQCFCLCELQSQYNHNERKCWNSSVAFGFNLFSIHQPRHFLLYATPEMVSA